MTWQDTNQQAIEKYLEDLLRDDLAFEDEQSLDAGFSFNEQQESVQEQNLRTALQSKVAAAPAEKIETDFKEPALNKVILPKLELPKEEAKPEEISTLAAVLEKMESQEQQQEEVAVAEAVPVETQVETQVEVQAEEAVEIPEIKVEPQTQVVVETSAEVTQEVEQESLAQPPALPPSWKNGRPAWAQERFECLLFNVKGLTLAVPLVELGGIIKIEDEPTPLFSQPSWFLGLIRSNNMNVAMVDTAQWVMPKALIDKHTEPYELIIRIHESHWGLACNAVDKSITLEPEQVRWRSSVTRRPWLAGTVIEHMCALIDVAAFDRLLQEGHGDLQPANLTSLKEGLADD